MNKTIFLVIVTAIVAFFVGVNISPANLTSNNQKMLEAPEEPVSKSVFYTCSMHPHIHDEHEGDCPICGMSLVKRKIELQGGNSNNKNRPEIYIESSVVNNFGIQTESVIRDSISKNIRIYGYVNKVKKPDNILLKSPVSGSVRFINKSSENNKFYKDEVVIALESDKVLKLQAQYLKSVKSKNLSTSRQLKQKLSQLGYTFDQLKNLVKAQKVSNIFKFRFPETGMLINSGVKLKQKIKAGQVIGELQPLYSISAVSKVYETQWIWFKAGQKISMRIRNVPDSIWHGEVRKVNDLGQSSTTAVKLFADFEGNPDVPLRLGMQTEMTVYTESKEDVLQVPSSAVINTGSKTIVVVAKGKGHFQPVDVITGLDNDEYVEIISGVKEGMKVVVSGQFLLDSESELRAEISRMSSSKPESQH